MSRHRNVRNLNIADELDDDALSDGGDEELTPEQQAQMNYALEQVRIVLGNEDLSGFSDNSIKDALWEYYFDVEKTVAWAFEERERRQIAKERKEHSDEQNWESHSDGNHQRGPYQYYQTIQIESAEDDEVAQHTGPRLPSIFLAQQQPGFDSAAYLEVPGTPMAVTKRLSRISEKSERTEPSTLWRPRQQYHIPNTPRSFVSSDTTSYGQEIAAKEREKASKLSQKSASGSSTPVKGPKKTNSIGIKLPPSRKPTADQQDLDLSGLNLKDKSTDVDPTEELPKMSMAKEKILEEARLTLDAEDQTGKKAISIVVIGHVDAGKSTLMGRLLYELGRLDEKTRKANERASEKIGKSSFSWAWGLDGTTEERERGITMDIALQTLETPHRHLTVLDAPGHKDFIPNMISGASQADCALLVVDSTIGEFESGFQRGGQTREHLLLVRSLGVSQVVVAVNKLDQVDWSQSRYQEICAELQPFLTQSGFQPSKTSYVPVSAMQGVNLVSLHETVASSLKQWYTGPTLVHLLDKLIPPIRDISSPLRVPISNVFKRQSSGAAVSGRLCGGVVQVGEKLQVLPGDEIAIVKSIELDETFVPWAASGSNVTLNLTAINPVTLGIGSVLCPPTDLVPLATLFTARILVFDIEIPITAGASMELFHHSRDVPVTTLKLISTIDRGSGKVLKANPRVLTKGVSAEVQIALRNVQVAGASQISRGIPLETFSTNKDMGRILIRRGGETIAAGVVLEING